MTPEDRIYITDLLREIVSEGIPSRVTFPESRLFPDVPYSSMAPPRLIVPLEERKPIRALEDGVDELRSYGRGDLLYMAPYGWTVPYWNVRHTFFSIVFYPTYVRYLKGECDASGVPPKPRFYHTARALAPPAHHLIQSLNQLPRFSRFASDAEALARLALRFALRHLETDDPEVEPARKANQTYQLACDYLNRNAHLPITRARAARELGITESHLSRLLHEHGQTSFSRYLLKLRMERAISLLSDRTLTVKEVAYHCGYRDDSYFIRAFSAYHGVSPGKWRL
jgi:AraC-like DNA-binding protein